jgi:hypothetical protein
LAATERLEPLDLRRLAAERPLAFAPPALALDLLALAFDLLVLPLDLLVLPLGLLALLARGLLALPLGLLALALGLLALVLVLPALVLAVLFAVPALDFGLALLDPDVPELFLVELPVLVERALPELALALAERLLPLPELAWADPLSPFAVDPLLDASVARALRRAWASLAIRSPEALPLLRFRAAVARVTEAASLAAAWALRGLLAIVVISSAEEAADLLGLLPHGPDLTGELAELLSGSADLVSHAAQVHLLRHRDPQDLALVLGLACQQGSTDCPDGGAEHRYPEVGESLVLAIGRLLISVRIACCGACLVRRASRRGAGALGCGRAARARSACPVLRSPVL